MTEPHVSISAKDRSGFSARKLRAAPTDVVLSSFVPAADAAELHVGGIATEAQVHELRAGAQSSHVQQKRKPRGYWKQPGIIAAEIKRFEAAYGEKFTPASAEQHGETALRDAVWRYSNIRTRRQRGYWQQSGAIEAEVQRVEAAHGGQFTPALLQEDREFGLRNALYRYTDLRVRRRRGYWQQPGAIEAEIRRFEAQYGETFTAASAKKYGERALLTAFYQDRKRKQAVQKEGMVQIRKIPPRRVVSHATLKDRIRGVLEGDLDWSNLAACKTTEAKTVFMSGTDNQRKEICRGCLGGGHCLAEAIQDGREHGIYGGMGPKERKEAVNRFGRDNIGKLVRYLRQRNNEYLARKLAS